MKKKAKRITLIVGISIIILIIMCVTSSKRNKNAIVKYALNYCVSTKLAEHIKESSGSGLKDLQAELTLSPPTKEKGTWYIEGNLVIKSDNIEALYNEDSSKEPTQLLNCMKEIYEGFHDVSYPICFTGPKGEEIEVKIKREQGRRFDDDCCKVISSNGRVFEYFYYFDRWSVDEELRVDGETIFTRNEDRPVHTGGTNTCPVCGGSGKIKYNYGSSDLEAILSGHDPSSFEDCYKCHGTGKIDSY